MYLKQIVTSGFKSFADKLDIKLDDKITCIVGPNGSGKSNVVDAVRWVLGEQSVKSLRGEGAMSDVIFSGSKSRKEMNVAFVELIFDNNDHYLNIPYTEISIKRKVYRSGENEYILNGEKCRLKDINDLLMDSGISKESFNIISQGEVSKILSSSSLDRRIIFEEAAGVLKYKKRKEEALRKLDRTHNNIDRVNDIINELEVQVEPLEKQSKSAKRYLEIKENLKKIEVALLAFDISSFNEQINIKKIRKEELNNDIMIISNEVSSNDVKVNSDEEKLMNYEKELTEINKELLELVKEVEKLNGERKLLDERSNYNSSLDAKEKIKNLLDKKGSITNSFEIIKEQINSLINNKNILDEKISNVKNNINKITNQKNMKSLEYSKLDHEIVNYKHRISSLTMEIENGGSVPNSVKSILKNEDLVGIYNTLGNIINIDSIYVKALDIALISSKNFIITKDELASKEAINYLKEKRLGRATFFPLTVIKKRYIDDTTLDRIKNDEDFIAVLSDLVTFDKIYENVIYNQLGNIIVSRDIDSATRLSKKINNKYKIVTLDGDVIHVGGSMSGGSSYNSKSILFLKTELFDLEKKVKFAEDSLLKINTDIDNFNKNLDEENSKYLDFSREKLLVNDELNSKIVEKRKIETDLNDVISMIESYSSIIDDSISKKEVELINKYNDKKNLVDKLNLRKKNLTVLISNLKIEIDNNKADDKLKSNKIKNLEKEVQQLEIDITRCDVKIEQMLNTLNEEYSLTYEKASSEYILDIDREEAVSKVNLYKSEIKSLGMVNLAAIDEYERVNTRYQFLIDQRSDLELAESSLLEIMNEMDSVIREEFLNTFNKIRMEFKNVFRELFHGGNADLILTNPDDLLTTGVDIMASPPGKKLTTISLLSGGEKTFTAISLLFAILNVKTVPFCLFDEVEAALDEANVDSFGKYLNNYRNKTQFLIITHKKKTMEFADTLYGITMQESGVSKLVSVKLNHKIESL